MSRTSSYQTWHVMYLVASIFLSKWTLADGAASSRARGYWALTSDFFRRGKSSLARVSIRVLCRVNFLSLYLSQDYPQGGGTCLPWLWCAITGKCKRQVLKSRRRTMNIRCNIMPDRSRQGLTWPRVLPASSRWGSLKKKCYWNKSRYKVGRRNIHWYMEHQMANIWGDSNGRRS